MTNVQRAETFLGTIVCCLLSSTLSISIYATATEGSSRHHPWAIGIVVPSVALMIMFLLWLSKFYD